MKGRHPVALLGLMLALGAGPALGEDSTDAEASAESLRKQLLAQEAINQQLRQRIELLERQLEPLQASDTPLVPGLDPSAPAPIDPPRAPGAATTAIDEALTGKGLVLLPAGGYRLTQSAGWGHDGAGAGRSDAYFYGLSAEAGAPFGLALALGNSHVWIDTRDGSREGTGDTRFSIARRLNDGSGGRLPSFVARLGYSDGKGDAAVSAGFPSYSASLSAMKRLDPLVVYGNASYGWRPAQERTLGGAPVDVKPGAVLGLGLGASLAVTPDVSLDAGLSYFGTGRVRLDGRPIPDSRTSEVYADLGAGFRLSRHWFLVVSASAGITDDASDFLFTVAVPYRF